MTKRQIEIKEYLIVNHFGVWGKAREKCWETVSNKHPMVCSCGKLCTGLHENYCRKFQDEVDRETLNELKDFIKGLGIFNRKSKKDS